MPSAVDLAVLFPLRTAGRDCDELDLMLLIDKQFLETPFYDVGQMSWHLGMRAMP